MPSLSFFSFKVSFFTFTSKSTLGAFFIASNTFVNEHSQSSSMHFLNTLANIALRLVCANVAAYFAPGWPSLYHALGVTNQIEYVPPPSTSSYDTHQSRTSTNFNGCGGLSCGCSFFIKSVDGNSFSPPSTFRAFPNTTKSDGFIAEVKATKFFSSAFSLTSKSSRIRMGRHCDCDCCCSRAVVVVVVVVTGTIAAATRAAAAAASPPPPANGASSGAI